MIKCSIYVTVGVHGNPGGQSEHQRHYKRSERPKRPGRLPESAICLQRRLYMRSILPQVWKSSFLNGPLAWNSLPESKRRLPTAGQFKIRLKTHLFHWTITSHLLPISTRHLKWLVFIYIVRTTNVILYCLAPKAYTVPSQRRHLDQECPACSGGFSRSASMQREA